MQQARLLIADDEGAIRETYAEMLLREGHHVDTAEDGTETLRRIRASHYDMLITDLVFPPTDGIQLLQEVKRIRPTLPVVLFSGHVSVDSVLSGFRAGAFDFLEKPVDRERLVALAARALEIRRLGERRRKVAEELESERLNVLKLRAQMLEDDPFDRLIGHSPSFTSFLETIREVARTDSTVLLTGESGTGKGVVARMIHEASMRHDGPFVEANCVVYSEGVLHSELFGHERGAFTGAARSKKGRFELAEGGTIFLDEIGEISHATQLMLLRVLQDRTFERVGGEETLSADARLIAATNRDLQKAIDEGAFRSDLFYRLNVIPVHLPALRERAEDVTVLANHFASRFAMRVGRAAPEFSGEALEALGAYGWPGNVRELENTVERLVVLNRGGAVEVRDLPPALREPVAAASTGERRGTLQDMERWRISDALAASGGNKKLAAQKLGIHRSTLYAKMKRYGLDAVEADEEAGVVEPLDA